MPNANGGLCAAFLCVGAARGNALFDMWYQNYYWLPQNDWLREMNVEFVEESAELSEPLGLFDGAHIRIGIMVYNNSGIFAGEYTIEGFFGCGDMGAYEDLESATELSRICSSVNNCTVDKMRPFEGICKECPAFIDSQGNEIWGYANTYVWDGQEPIYHSIMDCALIPGTLSDKSGTFQLTDVCFYDPE